MSLNHDLKLLQQQLDELQRQPGPDPTQLPKMLPAVFDKLRYILTNLQDTQEKLPSNKTKPFFHPVIEALSAHICILDETGVIVAVNGAWRDFAAANGGKPEQMSEGVNYLAVGEAAAGLTAEEAAAFAPAFEP